MQRMRFSWFVIENYGLGLQDRVIFMCVQEMQHVM